MKLTGYDMECVRCVRCNALATPYTVHRQNPYGVRAGELALSRVYGVYGQNTHTLYMLYSFFFGKGIMRRFKEDEGENKKYAPHARELKKTPYTPYTPYTKL